MAASAAAGSPGSAFSPWGGRGARRRAERPAAGAGRRPAGGPRPGRSLPASTPGGRRGGGRRRRQNARRRRLPEQGQETAGGRGVWAGVGDGNDAHEMQRFLGAGDGNVEQALGFMHGPLLFQAAQGHRRPWAAP